MGFEIQLTAMVVLAAVLHATWNAMVKNSDDSLLTMALVMGTVSLLGGIATFFVPVPREESWPLLAMSVLLHLAYQLILVQAYRMGDLSQVFPIFRGIPPILVAALSGLIAGEWLNLWQSLGVVVISMGVASLALNRSMSTPKDRAALAFALGTALAITAYTFADGLGVRRSGDALGYAAWMFLFNGIPYVLIAAWVRGPAFWPFLRANWLVGGGAGVVAATGFAIILWAFAQGALAPVAALRETSVVFAAIIGTLVLKEPFGRQRILAAVLVAVGIVLLHWAQAAGR